MRTLPGLIRRRPADLDVRHDPALVEEVVFRSVRQLEETGGGRIPRTYRLRRDRCYEIELPEAREAAFRAVHDELFRAVGLAAAVPRALDEFAGLPGTLDRVNVRRVVSAGEEGAELYVGEGSPPRRTVVVRTRIETWLDPEGLARVLRHEIGHVADMLDPAFAYDPDPAIPGETAARRAVALERFPILWAIRVDGRAEGRGLAPLRPRDEWWAECLRLYGPAASAGAFERIRSDPALTQADLLAAGLDPARLDPSDAPPSGAAAAGWRVHAPCPLCSFPSPDWVSDPGRLPPEVLRRILSRFPAWSPEDGLCGRCAEVFAALPDRASLPGPIVGETYRFPIGSG